MPRQEPGSICFGVRWLEALGRPHASLGPGIPDPLSERKQLVATGHRLPEHGRVIATPVLGGVHHEYHLAQEAA